MIFFCLPVCFFFFFIYSCIRLDFDNSQSKKKDRRKLILAPKFSYFKTSLDFRFSNFIKPYNAFFASSAPLVSTPSWFFLLHLTPSVVPAWYVLNSLIIIFFQQTKLKLSTEMQLVNSNFCALTTTVYEIPLWFPVFFSSSFKPRNPKIKSIWH